MNTIYVYNTSTEEDIGRGCRESEAHRKHTSLSSKRSSDWAKVSMGFIVTLVKGAHCMLATANGCQELSTTEIDDVGAVAGS